MQILGNAGGERGPGGDSIIIQALRRMSQRSRNGSSSLR